MSSCKDAGSNNVKRSCFHPACLSASINSQKRVQCTRLILQQSIAADTSLCVSGSIGTQTLDIIAEHGDRFELVALAAGGNVQLLAQQVRQFQPAVVAIRDAEKVAELKELIRDVPRQPEILVGEEGAIEVARHPDIDAVVTGIVGEHPCQGLHNNSLARRLATKKRDCKHWHYWWRPEKA